METESGSWRLYLPEDRETKHWRYQGHLGQGSKQDTFRVQCIGLKTGKHKELAVSGAFGPRIDTRYVSSTMYWAEDRET